MKRRLAAILALLAGLAGLAGAVRGFISEPAGEPAPSYQGYVEGEFIQLAAPATGRLDAVHVEAGDAVRKGDPLFELESGYELAALRAAEAERGAAEAILADMRTGKRPEEIAALEAQLAQAEAAERDSAARLERDRGLYLRGAVAKSQLDKSQAEGDAGLARVRELRENIRVARLPERGMRAAAQAAAVEAAGARAALAEWALANRKLASPADGRVQDLIRRRGEWVAAGQPVLRLLPPENLKIRFYVPETDLASMTVGRGLLVRLDGAPPFPAAVARVSSEAEFTPPVIYSDQSRHKLVFMVEARPAPGAGAGLNPGQPVRVEPR